MRLLSVLPLALSASALFVPTLIADRTTVVDALPAVAKFDRITLQCDGGCPTFLAKKDENVIPRLFTKNIKSKFVADIKVESGAVYFNGKQIWPQTDPPTTLSIKQVAEEKNLYRNFEPYSDLMPMSTAVEYKTHEYLVDSQTALQFQPIVIEIMAVADEVVHAESVEIRVMQSRAGLALLPSKIRPYQPSPLIDSCTNVWCRVRGTIAQKYHELSQAAAKKLNSWRGCGGKMRPHLAGGLRVKGGPNKFGPGSSLRPHHHHAHHRHGGRFARFVRRVVQVLIPPFIGMSIGLAVGSLINYLALRLQRRRALAHGDYTQVEQSEVEEEARVSMEGLPKYEDVYGEIESEKIDEKKDTQ